MLRTWKSTAFWKENPLPANLKVIDLAQDFRDESNGYVYGLPEVNRHRIDILKACCKPRLLRHRTAAVAAAACRSRQLVSDIQITGITGSTGAGVKPGATTHFSWRSDNMSVYKAFTHQHLAEINRTLTLLQPQFSCSINFVPMRGNFARGIFAASWLKSDLSIEEARDTYTRFYAGEPFTHIAPGDVDLKQAVNTNKAIIGMEKHGDYLLVTTAIDNLLKGASGQAVQNMNIMCGLTNAPDSTSSHPHSNTLSYDSF